uniref:Cystatin domain-containing protein n=1 Tax=Eptatretus burgeri TaxID=7764 RepID=A0A8C4QBR3_EPTBU
MEPLDGSNQAFQSFLKQATLCHPLVEKNNKNKFDKFVAVNFKTQVVAGTNFFIKVDVGNDWCVHLCVFKPLPCTGGKLSLSGVQKGKRLDDEIVYF